MNFAGELHDKPHTGFPAARPLDPMPASYLDPWATAWVGDAEHGWEAQGDPMEPTAVRQCRKPMKTKKKAASQ